MIEALFLLAMAANGQTATPPAPTGEAQGQRFDAPLEPASRGLIRCVSPDSETKTCTSITRYTLHAGGDFDAEVTGIVTNDPVRVVIEYRATGIIRNGAVCGVVKAADFAAGKLTGDGEPLAPAIETRVRRSLADSLAPLAGKMRCYREQVEGGERTAIVTIDGVGQPNLTQRVLWVSPEDGYTVSG